MLAPVISYLTVFTFRTGNIQLDTDCDKISQSPSSHPQSQMYPFGHPALASLINIKVYKLQHNVFYWTGRGRDESSISLSTLFV